MIGVEVKWFQIDGVWWCELRKQLGPHMFSIKRSIATANGDKPTPNQCIRHEDDGYNELKVEMNNLRMGC